jgi:hypothetical protein
MLYNVGPWVVGFVILCAAVLGFLKLRNRNLK